MLKDSISRAAFLTVLLAVSPALADDSTLSKQVNSLSQQVQDQQKEIDKLLSTLKQKQVAKKPTPTVPVQPPVATEEFVQSKPSVVAPLQPATLGTLRSSEVLNPQSMGTVSQAPTLAPTLSVPVGGTYQQNVTPPVQHVATVPVYQPAVMQPPASAASAPRQTASNTSNAMPGHVGEAPPTSTKPPEVQALSSVGGVLTPYGKVVIEPFLQYSRSSVNEFVFQGVEVVSALLIGSVQADRTARDLVSTGATFRVGVSDRLELEARVPYVWRQDSLTTTIPNSNNMTTTSTAQGFGLGDLEAAAHYQLNYGLHDWPFFVGNLRFKSDTGSSPYNTQYNSDGSAHTLATGSGFMAIEPSITAIYPSDPATLFANFGYIHSLSENINHNVGSNYVGNVAPGDTYIGSLGMGIALNDRLSFTLGYEHDYVRPTDTVVGGVKQSSQSLQVGSALSGISFKVNDRTSINLNLAAGITRDAPDAVVSLRVPVTLQAF